MCSEPDCTCLSPSLSKPSLPLTASRRLQTPLPLEGHPALQRGDPVMELTALQTSARLSAAWCFPFQPLAMTFDDMHYFVDVPAVGGSRPTWGCHGVLCEGGATAEQMFPCIGCRHSCSQEPLC